MRSRHWRTTAASSAMSNGPAAMPPACTWCARARPTSPPSTASPWLTCARKTPPPWPTWRCCSTLPRRPACRSSPGAPCRNPGRGACARPCWNPARGCWRPFGPCASALSATAMRANMGGSDNWSTRRASWGIPSWPERAAHCTARRSVQFFQRRLEMDILHQRNVGPAVVHRFYGFRDRQQIVDAQHPSDLVMDDDLDLLPVPVCHRPHQFRHRPENTELALDDAGDDAVACRGNLRQVDVDDRFLQCSDDREGQIDDLVLIQNGRVTEGDEW